MPHDYEAIATSVAQYLADRDIYLPAGTLRAAVEAALPAPAVETVDDARFLAQMIALQSGPELVDAIETAAAATAPRPSWHGDIDFGTRQNVEENMIELVDRWIETRQPLVAAPSEHRRRERLDSELRFQIAAAATAWAFWIRDPKAKSRGGEAA